MYCLITRYTCVTERKCARVPLLKHLLMIHNDINSPRISEFPGIGRLQINGNILEWWSDNRCIRRYVLNDDIIFAGFKDWYDIGNTLCIVLKDSVHFYYLDENDSFVMTLPFHTSDACFFKNGLILERIMKPISLDLHPEFENYRFISITHPMSPFGSIQFSVNLPDLSDLTLVSFPESEDFGVSVFYQETTAQLIFFSVQLVQEGSSSDTGNSKSAALTFKSAKSAVKKSYGNLTNNTPGSSDSMAVAIQRRKTSDIPYGFNNSNNLNHNLRKRSAYNRRTASTNWSTEDTLDLTSAHNQASKLAQTPKVMNSSLAKRSMSTNVDRIMEMTPILNGPDQQNSAEDFTRDAFLTRITSAKIPKLSANRKVASTRFDDKQGIAILDTDNNWGKIWIFTLNHSIMENVRFKAFGYSPVSMTKTMDIKPGLVRDVVEYRSKQLSGYFAFLQIDSVILYNPYLELTSPQFQLSKSQIERIYYISTDYMLCGRNRKWVKLIAPTTYPRGSSFKAIFESIKYVLNDHFHSFLSLWQLVRMELAQTHSGFNLDFTALEKTILRTYDKHENSFSHPLSLQVPSWIAKVTMCLHLMREEFQLNVYENELVRKLGELLTTLTCLMNWPLIWRSYYRCPNLFCPPLAQSFDQPIDEPPSIFKTLYSARLQSHVPLTPFITLSRVTDQESNMIDDQVTPRTNKMLKLFDALKNEPEANILSLLGQLNIDKKELDSLPIGIYVPLKRLLLDLENEIDHIDTDVNIELTDRSDLKIIARFLFTSKKRESNNLLTKSTELDLPETKTVLNIYKQIAERSLNINSGSAKVEAINQDTVSTKNPIFKHKELFEDFVKTLSYSRTHSIDLPNLRLDYAQLLALKKRTATAMAYRTLTSGLGYSAAFLCSDPTLNQHNFVEETLSLSFHFDMDDTVISLEKASFPDELLDWGAFHRGVSRGLALDTDKKPLTSNWLNFNNQDALDPEYGGFLLGLGLNGHLSVLGEWQLYNFLSPKNTYVSIGLLLGMCISMRGSMSLKMTKVLSVHVLALLPPGSSNLNIDYKIQSAGMIALGILYENTHNRRISELFSTEITSSIIVTEENVPDEGYRLACGIALGLINMGCGEKSINPRSWNDSDDINSNSNTINIPFKQSENNGRKMDESDFSFRNGTMDSKIIDKLAYQYSSDCQ